jgi:hypothetical protein
MKMELTGSSIILMKDHRSSWSIYKVPSPDFKPPGLGKERHENDGSVVTRTGTSNKGEKHNKVGLIQDVVGVRGCWCTRLKESGHEAGLPRHNIVESIFGMLSLLTGCVLEYHHALASFFVFFLYRVHWLEHMLMRSYHSCPFLANLNIHGHCDIDDQ